MPHNEVVLLAFCELISYLHCVVKRDSLIPKVSSIPPTPMISIHENSVSRLDIAAAADHRSSGSYEAIFSCTVHMADFNQWSLGALLIDAKRALSDHHSRCAAKIICTLGVLAAIEDDQFILEELKQFSRRLRGSTLIRSNTHPSKSKRLLTIPDRESQR